MLLEQEPTRQLSTFAGTEFRLPSDRAVMREDNSPVSVAFADPTLRFHGLAGDSYGDATGFFDLSHRQMHRLICRCHHGRHVSGKTAARVVRSIMASGNRSAWLRDRLAHLLG
jgi:hypothetical protein